MSNAEETPTAQTETEWLKQKLQTICTSSKFCGLCLKSNGNLCSVYIELLIGKQAYSKSLSDILNYVFNDDIENFMCSRQLCDRCLEKTIQSYLFINNTKQIFRVIQNCISDIHSKVVDIDEQLHSDVEYTNTQVMVVLENDPELNKNIVDLQSQSVEVVPSAICKVMNKDTENMLQVSIPETTMKLVSKRVGKPEEKLQIKKKIKKETEGTPNITLKGEKIVLNHVEKVECGDCDYQTQRKEHLIEHVNREHLDSPFKFASCGQQSRSELSLRTHIDQSHQDLACVYCDIQFKDNNTLESHRQACKLVERTFKCQWCDASFDLEEELAKHDNLRHSEGSHACQLCKSKFLTQMELVQHHEKVHGGVQCKKRRKHIECTLCNEFFKNLKELMEHEKLHNPEDVYPCKLCPKYFNTLKKLYVHNQKHYTLRITCPGCDKKVASSFFARHSARCSKSNTRDSAKRHVCNKCGKIFKFESVLSLHQRTHMDREPCPHCNKILKPLSLRRHIKQFHGKVSVKIRKRCALKRPTIECRRCGHVVARNTKAKTQCIMCLENFTENEAKTHRCKFSCSECSVMPCIHYKYLKSFREQVLNHVEKLECVDCNYQTQRKENLIEHVNREHLDTPFTFTSSGHQSCSELSLKTHIDQCHQDISCEYCDFQFKDNNTLESHRQACKLVERTFKCQWCDASFDLEEELAKHVNLRHSKGGHACQLCKSKFLTQMELDQHHAKVHGSVQCKKRRKHIECTLCDEFFKNLKELMEHEKLHNPKDVYPCKLCPKYFNTLKKLYVHNQKHYTLRITCPGCDKKVASSFFARHSARCSNTMESAKRHVCNKCGKVFKFESALFIHQRTHMDREPCPHCNKVLKPLSLRKHIEQFHEKVRVKIRKRCALKRSTIECQICGHVVACKSHLEAHINRFHLKIKPYVCDVCNKAFCGKSRLKAHLATHTSNKTCICSICGKNFANPVCLKMHFRMHTGEAPYACDICGQKFRSSSMMKTHRMKKHLEKTVSCPLCDRMFCIVREMRQHFKKVHWKYKDRPFNPREVEELDEAYYYLFEDRRMPKVE